VFTAIVAPVLFPTAAEYPIGLLLGCLAGTRRNGTPRPLTWIDPAAPVLTGALLVALVTFANSRNWVESPLATRGLILGLPLLVAALFWARPLRYALALAGILAASFVAERGGTTLRIDRTFFGVHRVLIGEWGDYVVLMNGGTVHGLQALRPARRRECLAYYSRVGPAGQVFESLRGRRTPREVAVLGLGAGTLACYATAGQHWTFFEIDPAVANIANTPGYFTYLADAPGQVGIVIGDARLSLTHMPTQSFDVLVLDVFSSDAVPVHFLTREALQIYLRHLATGGLILFHISNKYFDLRPIVNALAHDARLVALAERHTIDDAAISAGLYPSEWVVMARDALDLGELAEDARWETMPPGESKPWTDQYSNLVAAVRWRR
jgi:SAM-dependent methyltransferase